MATHSIQLNCIADTQLLRDSGNYLAATSNYGQTNPLMLCNGYRDSRPIFAFDMSSIPEDKIITGIYFNFKLNNFQGVDSGGVQYETNTNYPYVIRARSLTGITKAEIETSITDQQIRNNGGTDNILLVNALGQDSILNITAMYGSIVSMPINSPQIIEKTLYVGLRCDMNYFNSNGIKMQNTYANISSREGSFVPYILVIYEDPAPVAPSSLAPNNTTRNRAGQIKLNWQNQSTQKTFEVQYSTNGLASFTTATGGTENGYTIPANTFSAGQTVTWRVRITDTLDSYSPWSGTASFTIGTTTPLAPTTISPVDTTVNSSDDIYFRWKFVDDYGYQQAKYDLQYRKGTDASISVTDTSTKAIYILPKGSIGGGEFSWRVRCYNDFSEVSLWTDWKGFYSIGKPELPVILGASNSMHPVITWQSVGQNLFQVKIYKGEILIHDSGEQIAESNSYTVTDFIENGDYVLRLKINNIFGLWSDETAYNFTISFLKPQKPKISGASTENFAVDLLVESTTTKNLIYKKGPKESKYNLIATLDNNLYNDYLAGCGDNRYFVRAVNETGFNDSDEIVVNLSFNGIILNEGTDFINLWRTLNADKRKSITIGKEQYQIQLNGRIYPISQSMEFMTHSESHEYVIAIEMYDHLKEMLEKPLLQYRNDKGYYFPVQITNIQFSETELDLYTVSFSISRMEE